MKKILIVLGVIIGAALLFIMCSKDPLEKAAEEAESFRAAYEETADDFTNAPRTTEATSEAETTEEVTTEAETTTAAPTTKAETTAAKKKDSGSVNSDLKDFLDSYEDFVDEYVEFMEDYDSSDLSMVGDYAEMVADYTKMTAKLEKWDEDDMSAADLAYYTKVINRCNEKLLKVGIK